VELLILVKEDVFRKRPILGQNITGDNNTQISAGGNINTNKEMYRKRPILGRRVLVPTGPRLGTRDEPKPVKIKEPIQNWRRSEVGNVPLPKVDPTPPRPEAPQEPSPMDAAMEEIRQAQLEREKFGQMMGGAFSDGTNMITGLSPEARDMIGLLMAQGIPADQAQDIARQKLGE